MVKVENVGRGGQSLCMTTVESDGQIEETGFPVRGLVRVVLPQANVGGLAGW